MAIKMQAELGEDIQVLFIESQGSNNLQAETFALRQKWLGGNAMWTSERPFDIGLNGLPSCALLSPEGELVVAGYSGEVHGQVQDALEAFAKAKKRGPEGLPAAVGKLYVLAGKGECAKALAGARALAGDKDPEVVLGAAQALAKFEARASAELMRAEALADEGRFAEADARSARLMAALEGEAQLFERAQALAMRLASKELAGEREAAKALAGIEKKLLPEGPDKTSLKSLKSLAEKHPDTLAAKRALHLASLLGG